MVNLESAVKSSLSQYKATINDARHLRCDPVVLKFTVVSLIGSTVEFLYVSSAIPHFSPSILDRDGDVDIIFIFAIKISVSHRSQ